MGYPSVGGCIQTHLQHSVSGDLQINVFILKPSFNAFQFSSKVSQVASDLPTLLFDFPESLTAASLMEKEGFFSESSYPFISLCLSSGVHLAQHNMFKLPPSPKKQQKTNQK